MQRRAERGRRKFGPAFRTVSLARYFNWPRGRLGGAWWKELAQHVRTYPQGRRQPWGIPFQMARGSVRVILAAKGRHEVVIGLNARADYLCLLHEWRQLPESLRSEDPTEGLVVGAYELAYADGSREVLPVRGRFEVGMSESPGPPWLALPFHAWRAVDPEKHPPDVDWGQAQTGVTGLHGWPLVCAMANPHPKRTIRSMTIRGLQESPLVVAGLTLYTGAAHPLRHLPRRHYRVRAPGGPARIAGAEADLGVVTRIEHTDGPRGAAWLKSRWTGVNFPHPRAQRDAPRGEDLVEAAGAEDATLSVTLDGRKKPLDFSLGRAFHQGKSRCGSAVLEVLGKRRQWMQIRIIDRATGRPTPARVHFSGPRGQYIAPYGHHAQINTGWFMDYGADVVTAGKNFAYVPGEFTSDMPVGEVYVEVFKGFEYRPIRRKVTIRPGQKTLQLGVSRWKDWRSEGWVTADTHVHFISPHTAALQAQGEGVNVVNLLASQWGRLFTNVGDIRGRVNVLEDDTIVYVGTENRNHMLGHMSMLGTQGLPVYPMCCGGPSEAYLGDPDFLALAEWARENRRKGGVVIRPHFPYCGFTEDPVPILQGLVDALEIRRGDDFATQEWYRYLNCGYRVAVVGGTDKMGAYCPLGWVRTYAQLEGGRPLTYENWARAVRAGRTFTTTGPLIDLRVEGHPVSQTIRLPRGGGTLHVEARAESFLPLSRLEVVHNGQVAAAATNRRGARSLRLSVPVRARNSGWIAARCSGVPAHPGAYVAAHSSPVYLTCGDTRAFDGSAAEHMLALVEGGIEYLNTLATVFDEPSRKRMVKLFRQARRELKGRLLVEGGGGHHHGSGPYHTHGHGAKADHRHH